MTTLITLGATHVYAQADGTVIDTITSDLPPGHTLAIRANGGDLKIGTTGNIDIEPYAPPLRIPANATAIFYRQDLSGAPWKLGPISGPRAQVPLMHYITVADSPYTVPPGIGSIAVDASGGAVTINLPAPSVSPPGELIIIRRYDGSANAVTITGTSSTPSRGFLSRTNAATSERAIVFEHNGSGSNCWTPVAEYNPPARVHAFDSASNLGTLIIQDYTGGSPGAQIDDWYGDRDVILRVRANATNVPSSIVYRDSNGDSYHHILNALMYNGDSTGTHFGAVAGNVTGNVSGSAGSAAVAAALGVSPQTVSGTGSSPALHDLIAKLNVFGANLTDSTTP